MRPGSLLLAALFCPVILCAGDAPETPIKVSCAGLSLVAQSPTGEETLRPFSELPGTKIALLLSAPAGGMVQFDPGNSTISKFIDDKGNDLQTKVLPRPDKQPLRQQGFGMKGTFSKDGKGTVCLIDVNSPNLPASGATSIQLDGLISMLTASEKRGLLEKKVALTKGTRINAGTFALTIDATGKPDIGDEPLSLTFRSSSELNELAEIKFFKADGSEIKSFRSGTSKMAILGAVTVDWTYTLAEAVDTADVMLYVWSNLERKRVPFSLKIDVGL